jgi:hypothetical protein
MKKTEPDRRPRGETLVVEVKFVKRPMTSPDPRFIGQLLLARSLHEYVVGICVVVRNSSRLDRATIAALDATKAAVEHVGAHWVLIQVAAKHSGS